MIANALLQGKEIEKELDQILTYLYKKMDFKVQSNYQFWSVLGQMKSAVNTNKIKELGTSFMKLIPVFKELGAVKCFYTCLYAKELMTGFFEEEANGAKIKALYPALVEFLVDYIYYLDYKLVSFLNSQNEKNALKMLKKQMGVSTSLNRCSGYFQEFI